jgi:hypothetical protein
MIYISKDWSLVLFISILFRSKGNKQEILTIAEVNVSVPSYNLHVVTNSNVTPLSALQLNNCIAIIYQYQKTGSKWQ